MDHEDSAEYGDETIKQISVKRCFSGQEEDCYQNCVYEGKETRKEKGPTETAGAYKGMDYIMSNQSRKGKDKKLTICPR